MWCPGVWSPYCRKLEIADGRLACAVLYCSNAALAGSDVTSYVARMTSSAPAAYEKPACGSLLVDVTNGAETLICVAETNPAGQGCETSTTPRRVFEIGNDPGAVLMHSSAFQALNQKSRT